MRVSTRGRSNEDVRAPVLINLVPILTVCAGKCEANFASGAPLRTLTQLIQVTQNAHSRACAGREVCII